VDLGECGEFRFKFTDDAGVLSDPVWVEPSCAVMTFRTWGWSRETRHAHDRRARSPNSTCEHGIRMSKSRPTGLAELTRLFSATENPSKSFKQHLQRRSRHPITAFSSPTIPTNQTPPRTTPLKRISTSARSERHPPPCFPQNPEQTRFQTLLPLPPLTVAEPTSPQRLVRRL